MSTHTRLKLFKMFEYSHHYGCTSVDIFPLTTIPQEANSYMKQYVHDIGKI